jgi:putative transposase
LKPIRLRRSQYLSSRIEQDHRRIKRRVRPMMGFHAFSSAAATLAGIEMLHMMRKHLGSLAFNPKATLKDQFEAIAA